MQLAIDIGNSRIKFGVFSNRERIDFRACLREDAYSVLSELLNGFPIKNAIYSASGNLPEDLPNLLSDRKVKATTFTYSTPIPITNAYQSPQTLGMDRLAAAIGAQAGFPGQNILIIDAGTCITYDFVSADRVYCGGGISPGIQMRLKAMHLQTAKLPLFQFEDKLPPLIGLDTQSSMLSGAVHGALKEITGTISSYRSDYKLDVSIITGGDSGFLAREIKSITFADPDLVLRGLNEVLCHIENS